MLTTVNLPCFAPKTLLFTKPSFQHNLKIFQTKSIHPEMGYANLEEPCHVTFLISKTHFFLKRPSKISKKRINISKTALQNFFNPRPRLSLLHSLFADGCFSDWGPVMPRCGQWGGKFPLGAVPSARFGRVGILKRNEP